MNESFIVVLISLVLVKYNDVIFFLQVTFLSWFKFNFPHYQGWVLRQATFIRTKDFFLL